MVRLPVVSDVPDAVTFRCTDCGNCCTETVVPVTTVDVLRVARATGLRPDKIVSFYAPGSFVDGGRGLPFAALDVGPRVMGLAQTGDRRCKFHRSDRCTVYDVRPVVCRTFPFSIDEEAGLRMNEGVDCRYERDGVVDVAQVVRACRREGRQDVAWRRVIDAWNEQWAGGGRSEFLSFVGLGAPHR
jgi:Fe-S-cluster containining protein